MLCGTIIPESFFAARAEVLLWLLAGGAVVLLVFGADWAVSAAARLAAAIGMSKVLIGATVVSLGTTSPEAAVSVTAAIGGDGEMALGNGVGSIICDTALIFGLCCLIKRLPKDRFVLNRHGWLQVGAGALLFATALGLWWLSGDIENVIMPRWVGVGFLCLLVGYMYLSVRWSRAHPEIIPHEVAEAAQNVTGSVASAAERVTTSPKGKTARTVTNLIGLLIGLAMVIMGSELMVGSVRQIALNHHVPKAVIAGTLVAFGTSLPELVTAIASLIKGHSELLVGNVIGADILNVLFVIGASATATPLVIEPIFFWFLLPVMLAVLVLLRGFIFLPGDRFHRWMGLPLLGSYVVFVILAVKFGLAG